MIDGLVDQCGEDLVNLWQRDEGGTGQYPPPTLHVSIQSAHANTRLSPQVQTVTALLKNADLLIFSLWSTGLAGYLPPGEH